MSFLTTAACVGGRRRTAASAPRSGAHSGDDARGYLLDDQSAGAPRHRCGLERAGSVESEAIAPAGRRVAFYQAAAQPGT